MIPHVLDLQRDLTKWYIESDPTPLVLTPRIKEITPSGGTRWVDGPPRPEQRVKLIPLTYDPRPTVTINGVERIIDYHLFAEYGAQVAVGDHWSDPDGTRYEVIALADGLRYMVKALVERHLPPSAGA